MWKSAFCCATCQIHPSATPILRKSSPKSQQEHRIGFSCETTTGIGKSAPKRIGFLLLSTPPVPRSRRNPAKSWNYTKFPDSHRSGEKRSDVENRCGFWLLKAYEQVFHTLLRTHVENCETHLSTQRIARKTLDIPKVSTPLQHPLHSLSTP